MTRDLHLSRGLRPSDEILYAYSAKYFDTPLFRQGFYLAVAVLLVLALAIFKPMQSRPFIAMLAAAITFTLSFAVIGLACDFRFLYFLDLSVFVALVASTTMLPEAPRDFAKSAMKSV